MISDIFNQNPSKYQKGFKEHAERTEYLDSDLKKKTMTRTRTTTQKMVGKTRIWSTLPPNHTGWVQEVPKILFEKKPTHFSKKQNEFIFANNGYLNHETIISTLAANTRTLLIAWEQRMCVSHSKKRLQTMVGFCRCYCFIHNVSFLSFTAYCDQITVLSFPDQEVKDTQVIFKFLFYRC